MPFALRTLRSLPRASRCGVLARRYGDFTVPAGAADNFVLPKEAIESFRRDGYVVVRNLLSEAELAPIEKTYDAVMRREIPIPGKEFCDMSQSFDTKFEDFQIVNAMNVRRYYSALAGNIYEQRGQRLARQLYEGADMRYDYDQFLNKRPRKPNAVFAWHQDMAYWPPAHMVGGDTRTATLSLALDATTRANGCLKFIPGSHTAKTTRPHVPIGGSRDDAHAIAIKLDETKEKVVHVEINRGDVSIHDEWVVHGSAGNNTDGNRRTYVVAFRTEECVRKERELGFDHSHNNPVNWDSLNSHGKTK